MYKTPWQQASREAIFISGKNRQIVMHIGENIRRVREWKGIRREYVAAQLNIHLTALGNIERGQTDLTVSRLLQIAAILEVPPALLFEETSLPPGTGGELNTLTDQLNRLNSVLGQLLHTLQP